MVVTCRDEASQDRFVVDRIREHLEKGIPLHKQAVLFRSGHLSDSLEIALTTRNLPYHKYGGLRFLDAAHVKDLISFLRVSENASDEIAWHRVLQMIEGIGPATAAKIVNHITKTHDPLAIKTFAVPASAQVGWKELGKLMEDLVAAGEADPVAQIQRIRIFYERLMNLRYENATARVRDLDHIEQVATKYKSRRQLLTDLTLDPPNSTRDIAAHAAKDDDRLVLSTIHSAKGCEWDVVYVIHASDGSLPSEKSTGSEKELEEERRLAYVAMTRARDILYITWPMKVYQRWGGAGGKHAYAQISRFITDDVRASCTLMSFGDSGGYSGDHSDYQGDIIGRVRNQINSRWD